MKYPLLFTLLLLVHFSQGQSDSSHTPAKKQKYIMLGVLGNSTLINYRVYKTSRMAIRMGLDGKYDESEHTTSYVNAPHNLYRNKLLNANINVGFHWSVFSSSRLESYIGSDLSVGYTRVMNYVKNSQYTYDSNLDQYVFEYTREENEKISYLSPAIKPFVGCNFYVAKGLSLGVEYRIPLFTRYYPVSKAYSILYTDSLGNILNNQNYSSPFSDSNTDTRQTHFGLVGNTNVTVSFRIR